MTGMFHRSKLGKRCNFQSLEGFLALQKALTAAILLLHCAVSFLPRFIVQNHLTHSVIIAPLQGLENDVMDLLGAFLDSGFRASSLDWCTLAPGQSTIVYRLASLLSYGARTFYCFLI